MALYTTNDYLGKVIIGLSNNITGNETMSLFLIFLIFCGVMVLFKFPIESYFVLAFPFLIVVSLFNAFFVPLLALNILGLAFIMYNHIF